MYQNIAFLRRGRIVVKHGVVYVKTLKRRIPGQEDVFVLRLARRQDVDYQMRYNRI